MKLLTSKKDHKFYTQIGYIQALRDVLGELDIYEVDGEPRELSCKGEPLLNVGGHLFSWRSLTDYLPAVAQCDLLINVFDDIAIGLHGSLCDAVRDKPNICLSLFPYLKPNKHTSIYKQVLPTNWSYCAYRPHERKEPKYDGLFYYGSCRKQREELFETYLSTVLYDVHIATSSKHHDKFIEFAAAAEEHKPIVPYEDLWQWQMTLYLQDKKLDKMIGLPTCRFFEALGSKVPILFDYHCRRNMRVGGFDVDDFVVYADTCVEEFLKRPYDTWMDQQRRWGDKDYQALIRVELRDHLKDFI